jgi:AraC-like DNA-binding protein
LGYSQSAILNALKKKLHINFKHLCILKKIEGFESIVTADPLVSIGEAALKAGYRDVSYFSRLYKKSVLCRRRNLSNRLRANGKAPNI